MSDQTTVNGDKPSSAFLSHLTSYPVVCDSITTFKSNPIGQISLDLADQSYATFAKPVLPLLSRPYQYVSPYVHKADSMADHGLSKVEETFPIVKTPTGEIANKVLGTIFYPARVAYEGTDYVFKKYGDQYRNIDGGNGLVRSSKAAVATGLVVTSESLNWLSQYVGAKKEQAKQVAGEKMSG
ncbi:MAG: hypothetical protein M1816_004181 [Peltula sp. TS41687]|nr:MAG: hypothetical protein M1816_004181 [Peltula sp. TS41687]